MSKQAVEEETSVKKAFASNPEVILSDGRVIQIPKWSVRKAISMGNSMASIANTFIGLIRSRPSGEYLKAIQEAQEKGLSDGDPGWPNPDNFAGLDLGTFIAAIPALLETCSEELTNIIYQSLFLDGGPQLSQEEVLDSLDIDDFADVLSEVLKRNVTKRTVKKWSNLLKGIPGLG